MIIISRIWDTFFKFYTEDFRQSCHNCFLKVQSKDLRQTICFSLHIFKSISQLSAKSFLTLGKRSVWLDKPELSLYRGIFQRFSFGKTNRYIILRNFRGNFPDFGRYLSAGLAKSPPTNPAKHFVVSLQNKIRNSTNFQPLCSRRFYVFFPLRSKSFRTSDEQFSAGLSRLPFILRFQRILFEKIFFQKRLISKFIWNFER